jgi:hypothetical protein
MDSKTIFTLGAEDFPLVLTFDTLLRVLENTVESVFHFFLYKISR